MFSMGVHGPFHFKCKKSSRSHLPKSYRRIYCIIMYDILLCRYKPVLSIHNCYKSYLLGILFSIISVKMPKLQVSYKPQRITLKSTCSVRQLLHKKIPDPYVHPQFTADVIKPLKIPELFDQQVCILPSN